MDLIKKKFMPKSDHAICKGHCIKDNEDKSKEIDILVWDTHFSSRLYGADSDYNNVLPISIRAMIEVKSNIKDFKEGFIGILNEGSFVNKEIRKENSLKRSSMGERDKYPRIFAGVFVYEGYAKNDEDALKGLFKNNEIEEQLLRANFHNLPVILCVLGKNILAIYENFKVNFYELTNESIDIFLKMLRAWLEDDSNRILKKKPMFPTLYLKNPVEHRYG